jgi:ABC-type uncharacterized transport system permease subunit
MSGVLRHFALTAKTRTGFSAGIVVWAIVAAISIAATIIFLLITGFVAIAQRYDTVIAGLAEISAGSTAQSQGDQPVALNARPDQGDAR